VLLAYPYAFERASVKYYLARVHRPAAVPELDRFWQGTFCNIRQTQRDGEGCSHPHYIGHMDWNLLFTGLLTMRGHQTTIGYNVAPLFHYTSCGIQQTIFIIELLLAD
jgi:hypothetical protein